MEVCDETIKSDVVEALSRDSRLNAARITVTAQDGEVTLEGDTPTLYAVRVAMELAACVSGIRQLHSRLCVTPPVGCPADEDIKRCADQILRWTVSLGAARVRANVLDGRLTLEGEVDAYWKRERAEQLMSDLQGVTVVVNRLAVIPELVPQDYVIAEDVKTAIGRCTCTGLERIAVEVDHGLVTLTGSVPSLRSKHTTPHLVGSILGVTGVVDNLVVAAATD